MLCVLFPPLALVLLHFQMKHDEKTNNQLQNQVYELDQTKKVRSQGYVIFRSRLLFNYLPAHCKK